MQVHRYRCRRQARFYMHMRCHRHGFNTPLHCLYRLSLFSAALARSNLSGRLNNTGSAVRIALSNRHDLTSRIFYRRCTQQVLPEWTGSGQVLVHRKETSSAAYRGVLGLPVTDMRIVNKECHTLLAWALGIGHWALGFGRFFCLPNNKVANNPVMTKS